MAQSVGGRGMAWRPSGSARGIGGVLLGARMIMNARGEMRRVHVDALAIMARRNCGVYIG